MNLAAHHDPRALIGAPYVRLGDGPRGFDCFGLIVYVRREFFGLRTPVVGTPREPQAAILANTLTGAWRQVEPPGVPGDVAVMACATIHGPHHVGIVLTEGVLHAWQGSPRGGGGVMLTPWRALRAVFPRVEVWTTWPS